MATEKIQTLDQKRAAHAWAVVEEVAKWTDEKKKEEFRTQAKKLPSRIMSAGLGQSLAFLEAQGYAQRLLDGLADWMNTCRAAQGERRLVVRVIQGDADFLRYATAECLAYLQWLVRFADAHKQTGE